MRGLRGGGDEGDGTSLGVGGGGVGGGGLGGWGGGGGGGGILFSPPVSDHVAKTRAHNVHTEREGERGRGGDLATAQDQHILALSNVLLRNIASVFLEILQKMGQS